MNKYIRKIITRFKIHVPSNNRRAINFIIAGTQKGGTSALNAYLRAHPNVCMATRKEAHFFDNEKHFQNQHVDYQRYHSMFWPRKGENIIGDATPIYMYWDHAIERIAKYNPDIRIVVILRNPIERAYSHWNMERSKNAEDLPFSDAIHNEDQRIQEAHPLQHRVYSYVDRGFYARQIKRIWSFVPKEQTLIIRTEDLRADPQTALDRVCDFLNINRMQDIESRVVNSREYVSPISDDDRSYLSEIFKPDILELQELLNWDCNGWIE